MLDLKFVRENAELVKANAVNRNVTVDVDRILSLYDQRSDLIQRTEAARAQRNENASRMKAKLSEDERAALIAEGKDLKATIASLEVELAAVETNLAEAADSLPNMTHPDSPIGAEESSNRELEQIGTPPSFAFAAKDHVELGTTLDIVDFDTATKVSGTKFYYLRNEGVFLELALTRYALDLLQGRGFTPMITPDIAKIDVVSGIGFQPRGPESNIYTLENEDSALVGTAEITLGGYYSGQTIERGDLPIRLAGLSHCFRREAGAAGQFSKGLYRVHQFTKVEMFILSHPEDSDRLHLEMLEIEKELFSSLGIPFRVVDICTGDLGGPAYRKFDLEAWMPGRGEHGEWGEITSTSNCTDFQSRRLGIRYKDATSGERGFAHLLNGTAVAVSRAIIVLLEHYQQDDGSIVIPDVLRRYTGFDRITPKR